MNVSKIIIKIRCLRVCCIEKSAARPLALVDLRTVLFGWGIRRQGLDAAS